MAIRVLENHFGLVLSVAFSADGSTIASGSSDGTVLLWNGNTGTTIGGPISGHSGGVCSNAFTTKRSSCVLITASFDKPVRIWGFENHRRERNSYKAKQAFRAT